MRISTRGRYALRMMLDIALNESDTTVTLKSISERQNISVKYLEQIVAVLAKAGFVRSVRGAQGGYRLTRAAGGYTVGMILRATEGSLTPVACMEDDPNRCPRCAECLTLNVWKKIHSAVLNVVDNTTLADLVSTHHIKMRAADG